MVIYCDLHLLNHTCYGVANTLEKKNTLKTMKYTHGLKIYIKKGKTGNRTEGDMSKGALVDGLIVPNKIS